MKKNVSITNLFVDIGGVFLTNGWDRHSRKLACDTFALDYSEFEDLHHLTFDTYEEGNLTLEEYLNRVLFYKQRPFTMAQFQKFIFDQSKPLTEMIDLLTGLKKKYNLRIFALSNEGREINAHRIRTFHLTSFIDAFISSCYVHVRKPDFEIFHLALDISQADRSQVVYIENTHMFVDIARSLGIESILHTDYATTKKQLEQFGLQL
jgi:putative hydrolase of the HAD superfamily